MCCAALVFKEDIFFNHHHRCYLRDDETRGYLRRAIPEMCGLRARRRATMAFFKEVSRRRFSQTVDTLNVFFKTSFFFLTHVRYKKYQIKND